MLYKIFGCKVNKYFAEKSINELNNSSKKGFFVATCVVTDDAKQKGIKFIKDTIKKLEEDEKIYLSGCSVIKDGKIDNKFYKIYSELLPYKDKIIFLEANNFQNKIEKFKNAYLYTRKNIIIQNGCDNYCTYCLTIQSRGKHSSRNLNDILAEIKEFEKNGGKEIIITGINLGAYGCDNTKNFKSTRFPELLQTILEKTTIPRLRISSLGLEYINKELLKIFENTRINPHFHLSIQSGSDKILKSMNRNYDRKKLLEILKALNNLKRDDKVLVSIGADIIVGFPGEEDKDFKQSLELIKKFNITKVHGFKFSPHKDHYTVPAGKFPNQVNENLKSQRLKKLLKEAENIRTDFIKKNRGKSLKLLIEKIKGKSFSGWSENYISLDDTNFKPLILEKIKVGEILKGKLF